MMGREGRRADELDIPQLWACKSSREGTQNSVNSFFIMWSHLISTLEKSIVALIEMEAESSILPGSSPIKQCSDL